MAKCISKMEKKFHENEREKEKFGEHDGRKVGNRNQGRQHKIGVKVPN